MLTPVVVATSAISISSPRYICMNRKKVAATIEAIYSRSAESFLKSCSRLLLMVATRLLHPMA